MEAKLSLVLCAIALLLPSSLRGIPILLSGELHANTTETSVPKKTVPLFRDQDNIIDEKTEIFRGNPYVNGESLSPSLERRGVYCRRKAKCEPLMNTTCLGAEVPYSSSTTDLVALSQVQAMDKLRFWGETLSHVPKCWTVIQPFLCALYMPRCEDGTVDLPSQEMCKKAASACRILTDERHWISPLQCDDISRFPPLCKNDAIELRFNTSSQCMPPLVSTDNPSAYLEDVEGCGMQCANPLYTSEEHMQIQAYVWWVIVLLLCVSSFTVISFLIDWKYANRYPSVAVFYMNLCFVVTLLGFLAQAIPGARESIICRKDGTLRMSEPSAGENLSCVIVFILIYYSMIAMFVWFAIFMYAWCLQLQGLVAGKMKERINKCGAYFHLAAWCSPVVPTIATLASRSVDGNSELGICFVSMDPTARIFLLLGPVIISTTIGGYYSFRVRVSLDKLIKGCEEVISEGAHSRIRRNIFQVGICTALTFVLVIGVNATHIYEFQYRDSWLKDFHQYVTCKIMRAGEAEDSGGACQIKSKPSATLVLVQIGIIFLAGNLTNSWVWTPSNVHTWRRFLCQLLTKEGEKPVMHKKHNVIKRTYAKRQDLKHLKHLKRISISINSTRDDPVGLDFELNSMASGLMSSTWIAALPNLITRRGALTRASGSTSSQQRNSYDSDLSYGGRVSLESRRQSLDSQLSVAIGDMGRKPATPLGGVSGGRVKPRHKRRRRDHGRNLFTRRSSSTSQDSQLSVQLLSTLAMAIPSIQTCVPNMKRRTGNAGLDGDLPLSINAPINSPAWAASGISSLFPLFHRNISGSEEEGAPGRDRDPPTRELTGIDGSAQANYKAEKENSANEITPSKERKSSQASAVKVDGSNSTDDEEEAANRKNWDQDVTENNKRNSACLRRTQNKRYSKNDSKSGEEDLPMLNNKESGRKENDSDLSESEEDVSKEDAQTASISRLKHAREIGTQTSMLSVNEIDAVSVLR